MPDNNQATLVNQQDEYVPNIYKYTITLKFIIGDEVYDVDAYSVKSAVIDSNYKEMNMPLIFVTASIDRKIIDLMVQNQDTGTVIFDMKRCVTNSDMPDLYEDYIVDEFIYFISDDINKNDEQDFEGPNEDRTDLFRLTTFGLLCLDHVNKNKRELNGVLTGKLSSIMYYMTSHLSALVMEPPSTNKMMKNMYLPPTNSTAKALEYLNSLQVFYNTPYRFFIDFDCAYLLSSSGNAVPRKGETINDVLINLINSYKKASKAQGMIIDEAKSMYRLDVSAIDVELADYHVSDKSYSKIVGTDTMGTSTNTMLSRTDGSVVTSKTKAIRIANENSGLLSNMKASLDTAAVQMLVQKTDIDASVLTMNKKYTIKADDVYRSSDYNGTWLLIRKRELYIREDNNFTMSTMLLFEKI